MPLQPHPFVLMVPQLSREDRVLLCVAHPQVTLDRRTQLAALIASPIDWECLVALAERHQVLPLLYRHLQAAPVVAVLPAVMERLRVGARANVVWNLHLQQELLRILAAFNQAHIPVMPLKGPWLGEFLYGDMALRTTGDLDLLVRSQELGRAEQVLKDLGYRCGRSREHEEESYHYTFVCSDQHTLSVLVELHWDIVRAHIARHDMEEVWSAAVQGEWHGREIWTMSAPDLFLVLCQNAAKDTFGFLKQLVDVALVIERCGATWSWSALADIIRTAQMRTRVYLTVSLTQQLLGSQLPADFLMAIRPPRGISWYVGQYFFRWRGGLLHVSLADVGPPLNTVLAFLWEDSLHGKLQHLRRLLLPPGSYQARWTRRLSSAPLWQWYPLWVWQILRHILRFLLRPVIIDEKNSNMDTKGRE